MCVSIKKSKPMIAQSDIIVNKLFFDYKLLSDRCGKLPRLKVLSAKGRKLMTIVQEFIMLVGERYTTKLELIPSLYDDGKYEVIGFYSYSPDNVDREWGYHVVAECIIPAGAEYYKHKNQYISSELIVSKVIESK